MYFGARVLNNQRTSPLRSKMHRKWIAEQPCLMAGEQRCIGIVQCAHVRIGTDGSLSSKPSDTYSVPLSS